MLKLIAPHYRSTPPRFGVQQRTGPQPSFCKGKAGSYLQVHLGQGPQPHVPKVNLVKNNQINKNDTISPSTYCTPLSTTYRIVLYKLHFTTSAQRVRSMFLGEYLESNFLALPLALVLPDPPLQYSCASEHVLLCFF
jgi:hypothetical protein